MSLQCDVWTEHNDSVSMELKEQNFTKDFQLGLTSPGKQAVRAGCTTNGILIRSDPVEVSNIAFQYRIAYLSIVCGYDYICEGISYLSFRYFQLISYYLLN